MSMYRTPQEHAANPPESWTIERVDARNWRLRDASSILSGFPTRKQAEEARRRGFFVDLYEKERRWFAGEPVSGWKPYQVSG